jgi:hypothetical protein
MSGFMMVMVIDDHEIRAAKEGPLFDRVESCWTL